VAREGNLFDFQLSLFTMYRWGKELALARFCRRSLMRMFAFGVATIAALAASQVAQAGLVTYLGGDNAVTDLSQMTNSQAAEASFAAAVPGASLITFETALPSGVTISGGSITNTSLCGALCGFNTTPGGAFFDELDGGSLTFNFSKPIDAFGVYITGLQTDLVPQETLTFSDGATQTIDTPAATGGGGAFMGFTDFGKSIASVTYNATDDIVALDDVRYASSAIPEASTWAMMLIGFAGLGFAGYRKSRKVVSIAA